MASISVGAGTSQPPTHALDTSELFFPGISIEPFSLQNGTLLTDAVTAEQRFRFDRYLRQGRSFDLLLGADTASPGDPPVVLKGIRYVAEASQRSIELRRDIASVEAEALAAVHPALPDPVAVLLVDHPEFSERFPELASREPLVVYKYIDGLTLHAWLTRNHPAGAPLDVALPLLLQLVNCVDALHEHGFVHRALAPEHILVQPDGTLRLIGLGNAARREERVSPVKDFAVAPWTAPEIERELSGRFITPRADIYSLGALLGFLVTGESPTGSVEAPWTREAINTMSGLPDGVALIVAHCMQPLHKKRFAAARKLAPFLTPDSLPASTHPVFAEIALTSPWIDRPDDGGRVGKLSAGPLISRSVPAASGQPPAPAPGAGARTVRMASIGPTPSPPPEVRVGSPAVPRLLAVATAVVLAIIFVSLIRQILQG
jgi:serine/threonine protein kinase